jgi:Skp family chaperone for outer membrane proteins
MQDEAEDAKRQMTQRQEELFTQIYREVEEAARRVASRDALDLVLFYNDAVTAADFYNAANLQRKMTQPGALMPLVVAPGMDITDTVLEALNLQAGTPKGPRR